VVPSLAAAAALVLVVAGAAAAVETDTVTSYPRGLWWSLSLMTTVGFVGAPPSTTLGAILSVVLMVAGFFLLAMVSAALASLFVRDDERGFEDRETEATARVLERVERLRSELAEVRAAVDRSEPG
jgi:voltage-gated potassium channel